MTRRYPDYPEELKNAVDLNMDGNYVASIRLLRAYQKEHPDDVDALYLMADNMYDQGKIQQALDTANKVLEQQPDHYKALDVVAQSLQNLDYKNEARKLIERWLSLHNDLASASDIRSRQALAYTYWSVLSDLGDYNTALRVAQEYSDSNAFWRSRLVDTLVALRRLEEAEALYAADPDLLCQGIWDIGFTLVFQEAYEEALRYFLRCLAFAKLPHDFDFLLAYLECLLLVKNYQEAEALCQYWLNKGRLLRSPQARCLQALLSLVYEATGSAEASQEYILLSSSAYKSSKSYKLFLLRTMNFEETYAALERVVSVNLH